MLMTNTLFSSALPHHLLHVCNSCAITRATITRYCASSDGFDIYRLLFNWIRTHMIDMRCTAHAYPAVDLAHISGYRPLYIFRYIEL
jgi:hypothetical protein